MWIDEWSELIICKSCCVATMPLFPEVELGEFEHVSKCILYSTSTTALLIDKQLSRWGGGAAKHVCPYFRVMSQS